MTRLVLDTTVLAHAVRSRHGASNRILMAFSPKRVELLASVPLFIEWEASIIEPDDHPDASLDRITRDELLADLASLVVPVTLDMAWRPQLRTARDEMVLATAVTGDADAIISWNERIFSDTAARFGIATLSPQEALQRWWM